MVVYCILCETQLYVHYMWTLYNKQSLVVIDICSLYYAAHTMYDCRWHARNISHLFSLCDTSLFGASRSACMRWMKIRICNAVSILVIRWLSWVSSIVPLALMDNGGCVTFNLGRLLLNNCLEVFKHFIHALIHLSNSKGENKNNHN